MIFSEKKLNPKVYLCLIINISTEWEPKTGVGLQALAWLVG